MLTSKSLNASFIVSFLKVSSASKHLDDTTLRHVFKDFLQPLIQSAEPGASLTNICNDLKADDCGMLISELVGWCFLLDLSAQGNMLLDLVAAGVQTLGGKSVEDFTMPYLRSLLSEVPKLFPNSMKLSSALDERIVQRCVVCVVFTYVRNVVGPKPLPPRDWTRRKMCCEKGGGCVPCRQLDAFLQHPMQESAVIPMKTSERNHIEKQLKSKNGYWGGPEAKS